MLLRLLLVVILAFATPAMPAAACHDASAMAMMRGAMDNHHDQQPARAEHICVGCTAVADWNGARILPPIMLPAPRPAATIRTLSLVPGEAPTPPPPRMA